MQELSSEPGFRIEQCKYSLAELDATWQAIQDTIVQDLTGYIGVGIDASNSAVLLHYLDEDINNIKALCAKRRY